MIQYSLPPVSRPAMQPVDAVPQGVAESPDVRDFAALLASSLPGEAPPAATEPPLPVPVASELGTFDAASPAAATGKILPPELPQDAPNPDAVGAAPTALPTSKRPPGARIMQARRSALLDSPKVKSKGEEQKTASEVSAPAERSATPQGQDTQQTAPPIPVAPAFGQTFEPAVVARVLPEAVHPEPASRARAGAAPEAAFLRSPGTATPNAQGPVSPTPQSQPPRVQSLRIEVALPEAATHISALESRSHLRRLAQLDQTAPTAPMPGSDLTPVPPSPLPASASASSSVANLSASAPALRPHEFSALVDRLVAAREAVQPHAATLTVAHAEFGPVELRFRHEDRGIAVSLASADPDFARAAAAAPQPVLPTSAGAAPQNESNPSAAPRDAFATTAGSSGGQPRGQQGERRGDQTAHSNHAQRGPARPDAERRSGIFA